jgi:hypothetical protein
MTTTVTKTNSPSSKMKTFTGMESFSFKMVSILFIILLNATNISAQSFGPKSSNCSIIKPTMVYHKKSTTAKRPEAPKVYNIHIVREFPILEGVTKQDLKKMDEHEVFDYELIFGSVTSKTKTSLKPIFIATSETKNKI